METKEDLERASAIIPGATGLQPAGPAGGFLVSFSDPDGIPCNLVWGMEGNSTSAQESAPASDDKIPVINYPKEKPRKGEFRR